ncbi:hypothetical protein AB0L05_32370 [Nonomuraea pusilla]|uniref:hypothetical protein n=1 Tax=Nonomuraea pusilla TaxID=46177 RepID=UPI003330271A
MGFFGTYLYDGQRWTAHEDDPPPPPTEPWLMVNIYDSDIATVVYQPQGRGSGVAYLGFTPRTYFEDDEASPPTDVVREAMGLADWWMWRGRGEGEVEHAVKASELLGYLAQDEDPEEIELDDEEDVVDLDDADVFVEVKAARFLEALDLPIPEFFSD